MSVETVVSDAVAFFGQLKRNAGVMINVELGNIAAVVRLSASVLRQCVCKFVHSAIDVSLRGSTSTVHDAGKGKDSILRGSDSGPSVSLDRRDSIFDPFVSTKPTQLSTGGMGLGLYLVRRAFDAADGSSKVIDTDGGGAAIVARIPSVENPVHGAPE